MICSASRDLGKGLLFDEFMTVSLTRVTSIVVVGSPGTGVSRCRFDDSGFVASSLP